MSKDNYTPSLDELVFFEGEDSSVAPIVTDTIEQGTFDPTASGPKADEPEDIEDGEDIEVPESIDNSTENVESNTSNTNVEVTDEEDEDSDDEDSPEGNEGLTSYFNFLKQNEVLLLPEDYEFDGTEEGFEKAINDSKQNMASYGAQLIWEKLPKDFQTILEYGLSGGTDINKVREVINSQTDLDNIDIEDEDTQEQIIYEHLKKTTKYNDEKISKTIKRIKALGELGYEAESSLNELKEIYQEEKETLKQEALREQQEYQEKVKESYNIFKDTVSRLDGISEERKDKIIRSIWAYNKYEGVGEMSHFNYVDTLVKNNPEHLAQLAEIYLDYDPKKGFKSDSLTRKVKSQVTKNFRDTLEEITKTKLPSKSKTNTKKQKVTDQDVLEQFLAQRRTN